MWHAFWNNFLFYLSAPEKLHSMTWRKTSITQKVMTRNTKSQEAPPFPINNLTTLFLSQWIRLHVQDGICLWITWRIFQINLMNYVEVFSTLWYSFQLTLGKILGLKKCRINVDWFKSRINYNKKKTKEKYLVLFLSKTVKINDFWSSMTLS